MAIKEIPKSDPNRKQEFSEIGKNTETINNLAKEAFSKLIKNPEIIGVITFSAVPIAIGFIIYGFTSIAFAEVLIPALFISLLLIVSYIGIRALVKTSKQSIKDSKYKMPAITKCVSKRDAKKLTKLLENNPNIDVDEKHGGETPLLTAMKMYYSYDNDKDKLLEIIRILLEKGADISAEAIFKNSPLLTAIRANDLEMVKIFLEPHRLKNSLYFPLKNANISKLNLFNKIFLLAVQNKKILIAKYLLENFNEKIDDENKLIAIEKLNSPMLNKLISSEIKNSKKDLSLAKDKKDTSTIKDLLENVPVNNEKLCNLFLRSDFNDTEILKDILQEKYSNLLNLLLYKIASGNNETFLMHLSKLLSENNINLEFLKKDNNVDDFKNNALHIAIKNNNFALIEFLIKSRAINLEAKNSFEETPLIMAVKENNLKLVKLLIDAGANIETKNSLEKTPLLIAAEKDLNSDMTKFLIEKGANKNAEGIFGNSYSKILEEENEKMKKTKIPENLLEAVEANNLKKVKEFLEKGNINQEQINEALKASLLNNSMFNDTKAITTLLWNLSSKKL